jgi:hypothetical protein
VTRLEELQPNATVRGNFILPGHGAGRLRKFKGDKVDGWIRAGGAAKEPQGDQERRT